MEFEKTITQKPSHIFLGECFAFCRANCLQKGQPATSFRGSTEYKDDVYLKTTGERWGNVYNIIDSVKKTTAINIEYFTSMQWRTIYEWLLFSDGEDFGFMEIEISPIIK